VCTQVDEGTDQEGAAVTSTRAVYAISVAAELTGTAVQNLRVYERHGLVEPERTAGGTRRYSEADLDRIRRVLSLLADGLNLAGVALVLELQDDNRRLRDRLRAPRRTAGAEVVA
jgi:MerR family transcriptional regulator/heat shock protein HspR